MTDTVNRRIFEPHLGHGFRFSGAALLGSSMDVPQVSHWTPWVARFMALVYDDCLFCRNQSGLVWGGGECDLGSCGRREGLVRGVLGKTLSTELIKHF